MIFIKKNYRYYLPENQSPTFHQLSYFLKKIGWKKTRIKGRADFSEDNFLFNKNAAESLEFKHHFAKLCQSYCPENTPLTYSINDYNWPEVLSLIKNKSQRLWILKPALLNNGQHIKIFDNWQSIEKYYLNTQRMGGEFVIQEYISPPHLLKGPKLGHKYSIRMFVILNSETGAYIYPEGYFNIGLQPYPGNQFEDLSAHLTNEHLSHEKINVIQVPSSQYELFKPFYPQIKSITSKIIQGLRQEFPQAFSTKGIMKLALFGFDFMVSENEKLWVIEANHGPCFPIDKNHPLQEKLYYPFWQDLINDFIISYGNENNNEIERFEPLAR